MVIFHPYAVSTPSLALGARARPGESSKELSIIFRPFTIQAWRRGMVVAYNWDSSVYFHKLYIYTLYLYCIYLYIYIWVNCNNSLTWIKAIWGWFPLLTMIPVRSQWGRYKLPRYIYIYGISGCPVIYDQSERWKPHTSFTSLPFAAANPLSLSG